MAAAAGEPSRLKAALSMALSATTAAEKVERLATEMVDRGQLGQLLQAAQPEPTAEPGPPSPGGAT